MAISANDGIKQVICTGGETEIDFDFELLARADLKVIYKTGGVESTLTLNLQYTIPDESLNDSDGGVITLDAATYFPDGAIADDVFTLILDPAAERSTDFTPGGTIPYTTLNSEFDRIWQYMQKLARNIERAPRISETLTGKTVSLADPVDAYYLRFSGTAGAIEAVSGAAFITKEPEFQVSGDNFQWRLTDELTWNTLVDLRALWAGDVTGIETSTSGYVVVWDGTNGKQLGAGHPASATAAAETIPISDGSGKCDTWVSDASATVKGKVELATTAEVITGTDTERAVTPEGDKAALDARLSNASVIHAGTVQASTSGTAISFSDIPAWAKRITVMLQAVSTNGTDDLLIQIGDSGGYETTGYVSSGSIIENSEFNQVVASSTAGFIVITSAAADAISGNITLTNITGNYWICSYAGKNTTAIVCVGGGSKQLSATLNSVRVTTTGGSNTFDGGQINILYE